MKRAAIVILLMAACADRPLPDNSASMETGGSSGTNGSGGSAGTGGMGGQGTGGMGGEGGVGGGTGGTGGDRPDASRPDGGRQRDAAGGQSCTQILQCAANCGTDPTCFNNCCQMGTQQACQEAQALILCAIQNNCLGGSNTLQCLMQHCASQLQTCTGF